MSGWTAVDAARLRRAKAVLGLAPGFLGPSADSATFSRAVECAAVSRCVGLTDVVAYGGALPRQAVERVEAAMALMKTAGRGCSFEFARYFATRPADVLPQSVCRRACPTSCRARMSAVSSSWRFRAAW
ncbi:MAG: hypothetical protein AB1730_26340 [Myxococcota bacterium]